MENILTLIPERIRYHEFWVEIRRRNLWLIKLRYGAAVMIASLSLVLFLLKGIFANFNIQIVPLLAIALCICAYNFLFHKLWIYLHDHFEKEVQAYRYTGLSVKGTHSTSGQAPLFNQDRIEKWGFNSLHFSLIQIIADYISLALFIYFTGGVETPLYVLFIFHVIIGSLFLPGTIVVIITTATLLITITGAIFEMNGIIPHFGITGLLGVPLYNNTAYLIVFFLVISLTLYVSIYLANSIAKDLYRRQRSLSEAYKDLEEAENSKSRYVMSVVHDLKTPLAAVSTYLNMMSEGSYGDVTELQKKPLERSIARLANANEIINDILQISQLKLRENDGSHDQKESEFDLLELINEIVNDLKDNISTKSIAFSIVNSQNESIILKAEKRLIKLMLSNLITNAIKYSDTNGLVRVQIAQTENNLVISVADAGIGIPEKEKIKIFEDFYRSTISKRKGIEGTGLGMTIVREVVERYGGRITVESPSSLSQNKDLPGSEFIIELPKKLRKIGRLY